MSSQLANGRTLNARHASGFTAGLIHGQKFPALCTQLTAKLLCRKPI
ncbi:MAG TPA: hypothetical protein VN379_09395 [Sporomusa sp.]|nr:hypothetical protein [Sporomusa sp.]